MVYLTILLAAIAAWVFGALWYGLLGQTWVAAMGRTREDLAGPSGKPSPVPFVLSFLAELVMAFVLSALMARLAAGTIAGGLATGLTLWTGFVITTMGVNHAYSRQRPTLTAIDGGHWLGVLLIEGAVIGAFGF